MILQKSVKKRLNISIALACFALIFSQISCKQSRLSKRIIVASSGKIISLDPAQANTFHTLQLISALGDTLYEINDQGGLKPKLAKEKPHISKDRLTISIPLREDILFHDGTPFNAEAMAFSIRRFMNIGTLNYILGDRISSIETPNPYLIKLHLSRPSSSLDGILTSINLTPLSPKAYASHKDKFLNNKFIGTGPYQLKNFNNQQQKLVPFQHYWGKSPENLGIDFISLSNSTSLFGAIKSGEIDVLLSSSINEDQRKYLHNLSQKGLLKEGEGKPLEIGYITFRSNSIPLNDQLIRKALLYSLDRNLISQRVSYQLRDPLRSIIPPSLKSNSKSYWPTYNPKITRKLMRKSGYCDSNKLSIPLTFRSNVPTDKLLALTWQAQIRKDLSDCLELTLNGVESTTIYNQLGDGAYQAVLLDWRGAYPDPEAYLTPLLSCNKVNGMICEEGEAAISGSFWTSPSLEKLLKLSDQLRGKKRKNKLNEIERYAAQGAAYLPIWLVKPRAWAQTNISTPEFDGKGQLLLEKLKRVK